MKKLVFMFAAVVAVSFASCGGNTNNTDCCEDSCTVDTMEVVEEEVVDTVVVDSVAADSLN
ncbi:MAG: hypothetical protein NC206_04885 [Bacteroides sp.]|nr:hypothetical protein [Roseburia sp.]MCM1346400.1 hypothetical protein [Bacteroides sp.]MCM1420957.1 hypothetical protein [Bacteroides sp.]